MACVADGSVQPAAATPRLDIFTPLPEAVAEIQRRRSDTELPKQIEDYLQGDLPDYLCGPQPVLYLARHVATPNLETLHFIDITRPFGLPVVIGQDSHDKFVTHNAMKHALARMPVLCEYDDKASSQQPAASSQQPAARAYDAALDFITLLDCNRAQGKRLAHLVTTSGQPLIAFHNALLRQVLPDGIQLADDAAWIDRQQRGALAEHYKRFLALFVAHGVMVETYIPEDVTLVQQALLPAIAFIEQRFGVAPLICDLAAGCPRQADGNAYPAALRHSIRELLDVAG